MAVFPLGRLKIARTIARRIVRWQGRWGDDQYLNKIIFGHAVPADNWQEETGYGISGSIGDNEHPITVCDLGNRIVFKISENELKYGRVPDGYAPKKPWTFEQYCKLKNVPA